MKESLKPGLPVQFSFVVPENKTVPHILPESPEMQHMPHVLASGFMVAIIEWACIRALMPHLDWPEEMTLGTGFELTHSAPTPPGMTVTVSGKLESMEGRKLVFAISVHDGLDEVSRGTHERHVVNSSIFMARAAAKAAEASAR